MDKISLTTEPIKFSNIRTDSFLSKLKFWDGFKLFLVLFNYLCVILLLLNIFAFCLKTFDFGVECTQGAHIIFGK